MKEKVYATPSNATPAILVFKCSGFRHIFKLLSGFSIITILLIHSVGFSTTLIIFVSTNLGLIVSGTLLQALANKNQIFLLK